MENIKELIKQSSYFKDLEDKYIDILAEYAAFAEYDADSFIFMTREPADNFYLILSGKVTLQIFSHEKGSIVLEERNTGELLGWSWLNPPYTWRFDAYVLKKTKMIVFNAHLIKKKMESNAKFGYQIQNIFMNIVIDRLQATRIRLLKELGDNIYIQD